MAEDTYIDRALSLANIAEDLDEETLRDMGSTIVNWFNQDWADREPWMERTEEFMKLATQVMEEKNFPWPNAANVKYPLLTTAAMQFAARAYPALVPNERLVQGIVVGSDPMGEKRDKADRISKHMTFQLLYDMDGWEEDMDKLCLILPITGCLFKKTYYDPLKKKNVSELVLPKNLVIDYFASSVESAQRKTQILELNENAVYERKAAGLYLDEELGDPEKSNPARTDTSDEIAGYNSPAFTEATPHTFLECHTYWDLDDDGYAEPYIITVHYKSAKVVRVVARFDKKGVVQTDKKILRITPVEYFTKFGFIPNPDGSIYDLGFGLLLGGINDTVNTLTNQLLDSGTLNNLQSGFLGRGIRFRSGNSRFQPGEWKPVDFTGDDIKRHIFPLPTKEPSGVLFQLLEVLVTSGKELASVAEIFTGKMPGQNTPATTTMATVEQSMKVFTAIYKRIYRSLANEYIKLYRLNKLHLDSTVYFTINQNQQPEQLEVGKTDYDDDITVRPSADPNVASETQKLAKAQGLLELVQLGTVNPAVVTKRVLEAQEQPNIEELMTMPPPQPSPEMQKMQAEMQMKEAEFGLKERESQMKLQLQQQEAQLKLSMQEMQGKMDLMMKQQALQLEQVKGQIKEFTEYRKAQADSQRIQMDMEHSEMEHEQKMRHSEDDHEQKKKSVDKSE